MSSGRSTDGGKRFRSPGFGYGLLTSASVAIELGARQSMLAIDEWPALIHGGAIQSMLGNEIISPIA